MDAKQTKDIINESKVVVYQTTNYELFHHIKGNRECRFDKDLNVKVSQINLLPYQPIIVDKDFGIIDGQHRLEVARANNLPISFIIFEGDADKALISLNTCRKNWQQSDYMEYYANKGYTEYINLKKYKEDYGLNISNAILLYSCGKTGSTEFKNGKLKRGDDISIRVINFINACNLPADHKSQRYFIVALLRFFELHRYESKIIAKLAKKIDGCRKCARMEDYLDIFNNYIR